MDNGFKFAKKIKSSYSELAYDAIRNAILKGELKPGDRIRENEISAQMGISRAPIREALIRLEHEGLIYSHPYRETVVSEICIDEVEEVIVPVRRIIESYAARNAKKVMNDDDFQALFAIVSEMRDASAKDDLDMICDCDMRFHDFLIKKCVSQSLFSIWTNISGKIYSRFLYQGIKHETFENVVEEHIEYLKLIKEGDQNKINTHLKKHIY